MAKQETLTIFQETESVTRKLSDLQLGILMRAVMAYRWHGEGYDGDDLAVDIAFQFLARQVDRCEEAKAAKSKAARSRWESPEGRHGDADTMHSDAEGMQNDAEGMHNDADAMHSDAEGMQKHAPIHSVPVQSNPVHSCPVQSKSESVSSPDAQEEDSVFTRKSMPLTPSGLVRISVRDYGDLTGEMGSEEMYHWADYLEEEARLSGETDTEKNWAEEIRRCARDKPWDRGGY